MSDICIVITVTWCILRFILGADLHKALDFTVRKMIPPQWSELMHMDSAWLLCCGTAYQPWNRKIPKSLEDMMPIYTIYTNSFFKVHDQVSHQFARCRISSTLWFGALPTEVGPCVDQSQPKASSLKNISRTQTSNQPGRGQYPSSFFFQI